MRIQEPKVEVLAYTQLALDAHLDGPKGYDPCTDMARVVERCGRVSWKSEAKIGKGTADDFMVRVVNVRRDQSIAEHASITLLLTTDRYTTHQLVRHRIAAYTQESTHYINYAKADKGEELVFMRPLGIPVDSPAYQRYLAGCQRCEDDYFATIAEGHKHHAARFMVYGGLKTEIATTYNLRMWRHVIDQRITPNNTPEIVFLMKLILPVVWDLCPPMFEDLYKEHGQECAKARVASYGKAV